MADFKGTYNGEFISSLGYILFYFYFSSFSYFLISLSYYETNMIIINKLNKFLFTFSNYMSSNSSISLSLFNIMGNTNIKINSNTKKSKPITIIKLAPQNITLRA